MANKKHLIFFCTLILCLSTLTISSCKSTDNFFNSSNNNDSSQGDNISDGNTADIHTHNPTFIEKVSAGYATHGHSAYYKCECGKLFLDKACKKPTSLELLTLRSETGFDKHTYTKNGYTLNYCLYEPSGLDKENDKRPLILFLHGAGERGSNNEWQIKNAILNVVCEGEWAQSIIIAPQCPSETGGNTGSNINDPNKWVETPWSAGNYVQNNIPESAPLHAVAQLVQEYASYDYIDENRIYVIGLSMGGFGTWDIISRYPQLFAAAVPICGGGPSDRIDILKNIPIYAFHGTNDTVVPYFSSENMYNAITNAGGDKIIFYTYNGAGHSIWDNAITFAGDNGYPALEEWLFSQSKQSNN